MCYSTEASIKNWFLMLFLSVLLIITKTDNTSLWIMLFTLTFGQIQIIEALIWSNKEEYISYIPTLLWLQPIAQCLGAYLVSKNVYLLYAIVFFIIMLIKSYISKDTYLIKKSKNNQLIWQRYDENNKRIMMLGNGYLNITYLFGLLLPLFFIKDPILRLILISYGIGSLVYSINHGEAISSNWCFIAVGYPLLALIFKN